ARSKVPEVGQSLIFLFPFFYLGLFFLAKNKSKGGTLVFSWLLIAPLAAALTFQSPHALRSQNMTIPLNIIIALGIYELMLLINSKKHIWLSTASCLLITVLIGYSFTKYLHQYYIHYPKELPYAWQYGFDKIADYVKENYDKYDKIIISDRYDQPYIIMAFYLKYPPEKFQKEIILESRDKFGFSTVRSFDKFKFHPINYSLDKQNKNSLIVVADEYMPDEHVIHEIRDPYGNRIFRIARTKK
ncbi:hypothetical protein HY008_02685, partial [Candidatus Woesebacteria bacterium]|nr:hypothetical protein [Candidatus Woesebacteria bacterium]